MTKEPRISMPISVAFVVSKEESVADNQKPQGLIPDRLLRNIREGDCVLFLGADRSLDYAGAPLSRPELAAALAHKYDLPSDKSWPETAQAYLGKFPRDRQGLVAFLLEQCSGPEIQPGPLHEAVARVGFRAIVTAWYDDMLERALDKAGYRVNRVVRDRQLPYAAEGTRQVIVVKLYGCISDPESLVLGVWDHAELLARLSRKLEVVTAFCTVRPPLFVGFDLTDPAPMQLYAHASTNMIEDMKRVYAVWPDSLEEAQAAWQGRNIEFRRADAAAFLQALAGQLPRIDPSVGKTIRVQRLPYKFLDYYEANDSDIFCGRDTESQIVTRLVLSHPLLILFGPSGAGKTSLLLAGVVPRLAAEDYQHVYLRALDDPLLALRRAVAARAGRDDWEGNSTSASQASQSPEEDAYALRLFLEEMMTVEDKLVIILDQFEELFLRVGSRQRERFFGALATVLAQRTREVRFALSLREDYLPRLDEARDHLPDIFGNSYRLTTLDRSNARVAITEPAARAGVAVESALVDALVGHEGKDRIHRDEQGEPQEWKVGDLVEADGHVPPAALQIVLDHLYREALPPNHPTEDPPPPGVMLTLDSYHIIQHTQQHPGEESRVLTGAEAILAAYVSEGLARLRQVSHKANAILGEEILKVMVTSQATKAALTHTEIRDALA